MQPSTTVSVVLWGQAPDRLLHRCLESLTEQTLALTQLVVVDTAPTPREIPNTLLAPSRMHVVHVGDISATAAINLGVKASCEPLVVLARLGDVFEPDWLAQHADTHCQNPSLVAVVGSYLYALDDLSHAWMQRCDADLEYIHCLKMAQAEDISKYTYSSRNMSFMKTSWDRVGGLDEHLAPMHADIDFCCRLPHQGIPMVFAPLAHAWCHQWMNFSECMHYFFSKGKNLSMMHAKYPDYQPIDKLQKQIGHQPVDLEMGLALGQQLIALEQQLLAQSSNSCLVNHLLKPYCQQLLSMAEYAGFAQAPVDAELLC